MTPGHIIMKVTNNKLIPLPARYLKVGDYLQTTDGIQKIFNISTITGKPIRYLYSFNTIFSIKNRLHFRNISDTNNHRRALEPI